jgi:DnaJ-class molecular chaperone
VLGDPDKRKKYDELGANWRAYEQAGAREDRADSAVWRIRPAEAGAAAGWNANVGNRPITEDELRDILGDEGNPFSDFFQTFFGGGEETHAAHARTRRPRTARRARRRTRAHARPRGRVSRHDAAVGDVARRAGANRRCADSGRRVSTDRACA